MRTTIRTIDGDSRRFGWGLTLAAVGLLLACASVDASDSRTPPPLDSYYRETWSTRDGLPHNSINAIAQTPEGYLWFGTWEGVARFNGREFVNFDRDPLTGLPDSAVRALHVDDDGVLWVGGGRGGVAAVDSAGWRRFDAVGGLVNAIVRDRRGTVWIGTQNAGLWEFGKDGTRTLHDEAGGLPANSIAALIARDDTLWVGTTAGLVRYRDGRFEHVSESLGLPRIPVLSLAFDARGRLLVGTERGLHVANGAAGSGFSSVHPTLDEESVTAILGDAHGSLWVGTVGRGLYRISERGIERLDVGQGLPNSRVLALAADREGSLWIGTNGGLLRLSDAPFSSITRARGLSDDFVRAVMRHGDGSLWVGTSRGLDRVAWDDAGGARIDPLLSEMSVLSLASSGAGGVWVGTYQQGALLYRDGLVERALARDQGLPSSEIRAIVEARDGVLWLGTPQGLARVHQGDVRVLGRAEGLPDDYVFSLMEASDGTLWVGTGVGAGVVERDRVRAIPIGEASEAESVFDIHEDADGRHVWLVTDRGLVRWRREDDSLATVSRDSGLPFDKWFHLVDDGRGGFWLTSNRGVLLIDRAQAHAVADGVETDLAVEIFTEAEGMASAQCNGGSQPSATLADDGSVWVATARGVATVQPARLASFAEVVPTVVVESFVADGQRYDWRAPQVLPAGTARIEIRFAGLALRMPDRIRYRYRLEGFDRDWVERGNVSYAEFTTLPPGDYRFRVQAVQAHGRWGSEETELRFRIESFLWQRIEFWVAFALAVALLLYLLISLRLRRHQRNQAELQRLVERRTVELREKTEALERQAREDALTGLTNRRAFDENLAREFARARRQKSPLCLALLDIDRFKSINDRYSHAVGDEVLKAVAAQMRRQCRDIDLVSRWGGEEFALLFPGTRAEDARAICERLREGLATMDLDHLAPGLHLTASLGLASIQDVPDHDRLVARADAALYRAKQGGRNRVEGP